MKYSIEKFKTIPYHIKTIKKFNDGTTIFKYEDWMSIPNYSNIPELIENCEKYNNIESIQEVKSWYRNIKIKNILK